MEKEREKRDEYLFKSAALLGFKDSIFLRPTIFYVFFFIVYILNKNQNQNI